MFVLVVMMTFTSFTVKNDIMYCDVSCNLMNIVNVSFVSDDHITLTLVSDIQLRTCWPLSCYQL